MSNSNTIKITPSNTDIEGKLLTLVQNNMDSLNIDNIDFFKSGYFGYMTEALAMSIRDSAYYKSFLSREMSIYTATTPKFIYNWAKLFDINVLLATPAFANLMFQIPIDDINNKISIFQNTGTSISAYGINDNTKCIIIDKNSTIIADTINFSLEHSIVIIKNSSTDTSFIVRYCVDEENKTTEFGVYSNPIIPSTIIEVNGIKYLAFMATAYQYIPVETEHVITTTSQVNSKIFNFSYNNQICGLSLKYDKGNVSNNIDLYFSNIHENKNTENMYAYYALTDENNIEITCIDGTAGLPQNGGTLTFRVYETLGAAGNIEFNGNAIINFSNDQLSDMPVTITFTDGYAMSGANVNSLEDIKKSIINKISMRDTIITESDLNTFFTNETKYLRNINNTDASFKKERDDIIKRSFYVMLGMREISDSIDNVVIPTNTIDIKTEFTGNSINNGSISLTPNDSIIYDSDSGTYKFSSNSNNAVYRLPFNLNINLKDFKKSQYTYYATSDSSELNTSVITKLDNVLLPSSCGIFKNILDNYYTLKFNITSDVLLNSQNILKDGLFTLLIYLNDYSYTSYSVPKSSVTINVVGSNNTSGDIKQYEIAIKLFLDNTSGSPVCKFTESDNTSITINNSIKLGLKVSTYSNNSYIDVSFLSKNYLTMFTELDDIMSSNIVLHKNSENIIQSITIKDVPVIANYWCDYNDMSSFIKQLMIYINILKENANKLETNTSFNLKFKNTYGTSYYYDSNVTNIRLKLNIYLKPEGEILLEDTSREISLADEIRTFIRLAVDNANEDKELSVMKIIAAAFSNYSQYVAHIEFVSLNGTFNQYIKATELLTNGKQYAKSRYVDEYFTLDMTSDISGPQINKDILFYSNNTGNKIDI